MRPVRVDPSGRDGPTRHQAAGPTWVRTSTGFYVPAGTPRDRPEQRILEQSMRLPAGGAVTGWAACRLARAAFFDGLARDGLTRLPVPLAVGPDGRLRADGDAVATYDRIDEGEVVEVCGIPALTALRATFDAMRLAADVREAVVALDMMAAARRMSLRRLASYADLRAGAHGIAKVRAAVPLASEHSRSPNETRLRLCWVLDAGLPPPLVNCPVYGDGGALLGIADLLDDEAGLAVEFDGADHRSAGQHTRDVAKEDAFRRHGIEVARVTGADLWDRELVVDRLREARGRARFEPATTRRWEPRPEPDVLDRLLDQQDGLDALRSLPEAGAGPSLTGLP